MFVKHDATVPNERISPAGAGSYVQVHIARWAGLPQARRLRLVGLFHRVQDPLMFLPQVFRKAVAEFFQVFPD